MKAEQSAELTGTNGSCGLAIPLRHSSESLPRARAPGKREHRVRSSDAEPRSTQLFWTLRGSRAHPQISGGDIEEVTPDPIPNSEVKLLGADGTAGATQWESRTPPGFFPQRPVCPAHAGLCLFVFQPSRPRGFSVLALGRFGLGQGVVFLIFQVLKIPPIPPTPLTLPSGG